MTRAFSVFLLLIIPVLAESQQSQIDKFMADSAMKHASVSFCIIDADSGKIISQYNKDRSLTQASILKLITTATALEKLGRDYKFTTSIGYSGIIRKGARTLDGNIIIKGGGDPSLGSENFKENYSGFIEKWIESIQTLGIKKINGQVIADDSYYDFESVPSGWSWDDLGNYYGAGASGLSVYDNSIQVHFKTEGKGSVPVMKEILPAGTGLNLISYLTASGTTDNGYIFMAPYSSGGWISGTIPENKEDFILNGSIPDPPAFLAKSIDSKLREAGIRISGNPVTVRTRPELINQGFTVISELKSPPLSSIIEVLNHKSVNLYAEHLIKELGKVFRNSGTTVEGAEVIKEFLDSAGLNTEGMFIDDGSGLSPRDAVNASEMTKLLLFMKKKGAYFNEYFNSLPEAGKNGTLKNYFRDPVFESRLHAKSGSMTRVRSYAGYFTTMSGKQMIFCIIVDNYSGSSRKVISGIEDILKDCIINQ